MQRQLYIEQLDHQAFLPFGDVIESRGTPSVVINRGMCDRYSDLASLDFIEGGRAGISVFHGQPYELPLQLDYVERHPLGSQAFLPMSEDPFLVVVAEDNAGIPGKPRVFISQAGQGVNYHRGVWHGVLTPLKRAAMFAVIDRIGEGDNLAEYWFEEPYHIEASR